MSNSLPVYPIDLTHLTELDIRVVRKLCGARFPDESVVGNAGWVSVGTLALFLRSVLGQQGAPLPAPTKVANGRPGRWRWLQLAAGPRGALTASDLLGSGEMILAPPRQGLVVRVSDVTRPQESGLVGAGRARGKRRQVHHAGQRSN